MATSGSSLRRPHSRTSPFNWHQRIGSKMQAFARILRSRISVSAFLADTRALAATEFAVIVPLMLVMFFGTVEFSSTVAIDRKVTLIARTLSDLTSQTPPPGTL